MQFAHFQLLGPRETQEDSLLCVVSDTYARFILADGMGGHEKGEVASATAVDVLSKRAPMLSADAINCGFSDAQAAVRAIPFDGYRAPGTTCTMLELGGMHGHVAHIGDSRCYRENDGELFCLTTDHTYGRFLDKCLGSSEESAPDIQWVHLDNGRRFLLCSDGLTNALSDGEILRALSQSSTPAEACERLRDMVELAGLVDNTSVIVVFA